MDKELLYNKIEQYLTGELKGEELIAFESELKNNPELASEVALHRELEIALTDEKTIDFEKKMMTSFGEAKQEQQLSSDDKIKKQKTNRVISMRRYMAAAASVLLLIIGGVFVYQNSNSSNQDLTTYISNTVDYPKAISTTIFNTETIRDNTDLAQQQKRKAEIDEQWSEISDAYENKDFENVITLSDKLNKNRQYLIQSDYFYIRGLSFLQLGNAKEAFESFSKCKAQTAKEENDAKWYRALSALQMKTEREKEIGRELLEELASTKSAYQEPAKKLLRKMQ